VSELVRAALAAVVEGRSLTMEDSRAAMGAVMDGEATSAQLAALLIALRMRGETTAELAGFATAMRERVLRVSAPRGAIDLVGTGGDGSGTFNISTTSALVVAAAGVPVAKHGNRAITSRSGSADVLDALGIRIDHDDFSAAEALRTDGFAFLFALAFHPAMRYAGPTRKEIGVRTAFNLLGPRTNPAGVDRLVVGVGDAAMAPKVAEVLRLLGQQRAIVVHGAGVDELPLDGSGVIHDVSPAGISVARLDVRELERLGLTSVPTSTLAGGTPEENAGLVQSVLGGTPGPRREVVMLNAAAGFVAAGRVANLAQGVRLASMTLDSGAPIALVGRLRVARLAADAAKQALARLESDAGAPA
jgi:anthranilate phosphoribosyltransferase